MSDTYIYSIGVIGSGVMGEALVSAILKSGIANSVLAISDKCVENYGVSSQIRLQRHFA